ncbi:MAG: cysteine peptidase family C39 domain-containing protein, partial [Phycisphaerales bacterium]|nr:cysteine peptidase family C39 domain-containing protein [Phycisphaerales bacterium]
MAARDTTRGRGRLVKTPTILQMEAVECGAACLAMILAHYRRYIPLDQLREDVGVSRDGAKASQIRTAARKHGLEFKAMRREIEQLETESPRPSIIFWGFGHFVVFEGVTKGLYRINDPASGRRLVPPEEFSKRFTGVVLELEKGGDFKCEGRPTSLFSGFYKWMAGSWLLFIFPMICGVLVAVPGVIAPGLTSVFINDVVIGQRLHWTGGIVTGLTCAAFILCILTWMQQSCLLRLQSRLFIKSSVKMSEHLVKLPLKYFMQRMPGDIVSRLMGNQRIAVELTNGLANGIVNAVTAMAYALAMLAFDWKIGLISILAATGILLAVRSTDQRVMDRNTSLKKEVGAQYGTLMMLYRNITEIKATSREMEVFSAWGGYQAKSANAQQGLGVITTWLNGLPVLVNGILINVIILTFGGLQVMNGSLTLGGLIAMQMLGTLLVVPIQQLVILTQKLQNTRADMERVDDVLNHPVCPTMAKSGSKDLRWVGGTPQKLSGAAEFKEVTFRYNPDAPPLLDGVSFRIDPGEWVAIVGGSGSGKSTVANLLVGLQRQESGEIILDDVPILDIPPEQRINSITGVNEEISIFRGTIR